jgi:gluconolactonase
MVSPAQATVVAADVNGPNGLAFSPDEKRLYVVESRARPRNILVFDVVDDGTRLRAAACWWMPAQARRMASGWMCMATSGAAGVWATRSWTACASSRPRASPSATSHLPERCANLCFGGRHRNRLFMAASHSIYALHVNTQGTSGG